MVVCRVIGPVFLEEPTSHKLSQHFSVMGRPHSYLCLLVQVAFPSPQFCPGKYSIIVREIADICLKGVKNHRAQGLDVNNHWKKDEESKR